MDNWYFFVRDTTQREDIKLKWIDSHINPADGLMKPWNN